MSWWYPNEFARRRPNLEARARITAGLRAWFGERGFIEVETPILQVSPGMEPHIHAFATDLTGPRGETARRYLHTSPEFAMKKLMAAGLDRQFQLARVFRNGERAATHHPEFTMLEWYRAGTDYQALMEDCDGLLAMALGAAGKPEFRRGAFSCAALPAERLSVAQAFARHAGIDLPTVMDDTPGFARAAGECGSPAHDGDGWDDIFFRIMADRIEPNLGMGRPTVLYDYPVAMAALSRPKPGSPELAERFELYVCGVELANAFSELTDAAEQRRRFEADMDLKERLYGTRHPIDEEFLQAVSRLPRSAGSALGFDRLVMLATGAERLEDVLWAPVEGPDEA